MSPAVYEPAVNRLSGMLISKPVPCKSMLMNRDADFKYKKMISSTPNMQRNVSCNFATIHFRTSSTILHAKTQPHVLPRTRLDAVKRRHALPPFQKSEHPKRTKPLRTRHVCMHKPSETLHPRLL
jgi:hypothetical protein